MMDVPELFAEQMKDNIDPHDVSSSADASISDWDVLKATDTLPFPLLTPVGEAEIITTIEISDEEEIEGDSLVQLNKEEPENVPKTEQPIGINGLYIKRHKLKVAGAPKVPLTGYVRYMRERRKSLRIQFPNRSVMEYMKIIGEEWHTLSAEKKARYMAAANFDKQRYILELKMFLLSNPDVLANEHVRNSERQKNGISPKSLQKKRMPWGNNNAGAKAAYKRKPKRKNKLNSTRAEVGRPRKISIFTDEFLEHNKAANIQITAIRNKVGDFAQRNTVLENHVNQMQWSVSQLMGENNQLEENNRLLELYLVQVRRKLADALGNVGLPTEPHGATFENIDKYMNDLYALAKKPILETSDAAILKQAKGIIEQLDLEIKDIIN